MNTPGGRKTALEGGGVMPFSTKDVELVPYALNFGTQLSGDPTGYGTTAAIAADFEAKRLAYTTAYNAVVAAKEAGIRDSQLVATKDNLKAELLELGRGLYAAIQWSASISDTMKIAANVHVRKTSPTPTPPPAFAPGMAIESVNGRLVQVRVYDSQDTTSKARPAGTFCVVMLSHVGDAPPEDIRDWTLEGASGDLKVDVLFPESCTPGTKVWVTGYWLNGNKASSPACQPVSAVINYPASMPTTGADAA
jgi:hypothetical protein